MITEAPAKMRILTTASHLFYQRGLHAVGVDEVVARSGVAKTTLYAHFRSKDELIAAYLARQSGSWRALLEEKLAAFDGTPAESLDYVFQLIEGGCAEDSFRGCPFINFVVEYPDRTHPAWEVCLTHRRWLHQLLQNQAQVGCAIDPAGLADQLCLLYDAAMVGSMFDGNGRSARVMRDAAATLVQAAIPVQP